MDYRNLGNSGLKVSTLCLGTMTFGEADETSFMHGIGCDEAMAHAIMNRALDGGVNFIDTADVYGQDGLSEQVIGRWFEREKRRDEVVLATKFRFTMGQGPNASGASRYRILRTVEESLRRLKTDRIDLYQIHMQDIATPEEETLRALDDLVRDGKVLYLGASNYAAYRLVDSLWTSETRNLHRFVTLQAQYSLMVRDVEREHVPACERFGLGIIAWSPLAGGFLSGKYRRNQARPGGSRYERWQDRWEGFDTTHNWRILDTVETIGQEVGATPAQVSLAWLLNRPAVTSAIIGARSVDQLDDNLKAAHVQLGDEAMARLNEINQLQIGYPYALMKRVQERW
jgi:aryl-alcohol dehydrogenase-like predicted oxidoreductase